MLGLVASSTVQDLIKPKEYKLVPDLNLPRRVTEDVVEFATNLYDKDEFGVFNQAILISDIYDEIGLKRLDTRLVDILREQNPDKLKETVREVLNEDIDDMRDIGDILDLLENIKERIINFIVTYILAGITPLIDVSPQCLAQSKAYLSHLLPGEQFDTFALRSKFC